MSTVVDLDAMPPERAAELLRACCGALRWVEAMLARRPFRTLPNVLAAADEIWSSLGPADWLEAFAHHPRIGERASAVTQDARGAAWSAGEQARVGDAAPDVRAELAAANRAYEARFGHIFIVCATGKSAEDMLALLTARLANDPDTELRVAAEEQRKITRLRLERLLAAG